jgi:hypothetical protein
MLFISVPPPPKPKEYQFRGYFFIFPTKYSKDNKKIIKKTLKCSDSAVLQKKQQDFTKNWRKLSIILKLFLNLNSLLFFFCFFIFKQYGLSYHPKFSSHWRKYPFDTKPLADLFEEATYHPDEYFIQYGLNGNTSCKWCDKGIRGTFAQLFLIMIIKK